MIKQAKTERGVEIDFCDAYKEMQESEDFEGDDIIEEPEDDEDSKK